MAKIEMEIPSQTLFHTQALVFNPILDLFSVSHSLINQNLTLHLSLCSLYSQSQISLVSSLNPSLHTLHNPNPSCWRCCLITTLTALPHFPPWVKLLSLLMLIDQLLSLKTLRYIFFLFHLSFSLF